MKWTTVVRDLIHGWTWVDLRSGQPLETGMWFFTMAGANRDALKAQERENRDREARGMEGRGVAYVVIPNADLQEFLDGWDTRESKLRPEEIQAAARLQPGESLTLSTGVTIRRTGK